MGNLSKLPLQYVYHRGQHNIADEFYLPAMSISSFYDRAVGFFSSAVYIIAWSALLRFVVDNRGKMRFIASPRLFSEDYAAINEGYDALTDDELENKLIEEFNKLLASRQLEKPARILSYLISQGLLEFRLAEPATGSPPPPPTKKLFHDKVGIFTDSIGNKVVFSGSMNETYYGLSDDGNIESVDVFRSWTSGDDQHRVQERIDHFERLWKNEQPGVKTRHFPQGVINQISQSGPKDFSEFTDIVDDICKDLQIAKSYTGKSPKGRILQPHQFAVLESWEKADRRGIVKHATGAGKTFTAVCAIRRALAMNEIPLVLVPAKVLFLQWYKELVDELKDFSPSILRCGAGYDAWQEDETLSLYSSPKYGDRKRCILAMIPTASGDGFLKMINGGAHLFVVCDEVHRIGSPDNRRILEGLKCGPRMGLSATPERYGDPEGTQAIFNFFGDILKPEYSLQDAIKDGVLTPYMYHVHTVGLAPSEQRLWDDLSLQIYRLAGRIHGDKKHGVLFKDRLQALIIKRSRIPKNACLKLNEVIRVLEIYHKPGQKWLVYCDSNKQMNALRKQIRESKVIGKTPILEYHSRLADDVKNQVMEYIKGNDCIVLAIRCLDEGVDIPSVTHALIIASSRNPREYIQRRGRVLRKPRDGSKLIAEIHDILVTPSMPAPDPGEPPLIDSLTVREAARARQFAQWSLNKEHTKTEFTNIAIRLGVTVEELINAVGGGEEDDDEQD